MDKTKLQWHPAFSAALRITLQDEMKYLEMHEEYLLGKKPLQMDLLLIKKIKIFRYKNRSAGYLENTISLNINLRTIT